MAAGIGFAQRKESVCFVYEEEEEVTISFPHEGEEPPCSVQWEVGPVSLSSYKIYYINGIFNPKKKSC